MGYKDHKISSSRQHSRQSLARGCCLECYFTFRLRWSHDFTDPGGGQSNSDESSHIFRVEMEL